MSMATLFTVVKNWIYYTDTEQNALKRRSWDTKQEKQDAENYLCYDPTFVKETNV